MINQAGRGPIAGKVFCSGCQPCVFILLKIQSEEGHVHCGIVNMTTVTGIETIPHRDPADRTIFREPVDGYPAASLCHVVGTADQLDRRRFGVDMDLFFQIDPIAFAPLAQRVVPDHHADDALAVDFPNLSPAGYVEIAVGVESNGRHPRQWLRGSRLTVPWKALFAVAGDCQHVPV